MTDADLYALAERLFPLKRTVQGHAVLETLSILDAWIDGNRAITSIAGTHESRSVLVRTEVPVGTKVFDWTVLPDAENRRAYHPTLEEVPAYDGPLTYAELAIPGESSQEILLSTYTCHPSMANDNVSGMVVTATLAKWLASSPRRYTYRVLFAPETIGALCWLHNNCFTAATKHHRTDKIFSRVLNGAVLDRIIAGYTINNCGDERAWSFIPSRKGDTLADRAATHVLLQQEPKGGYFTLGPKGVELIRQLSGTTTASLVPQCPTKLYTFADRGSDERQFCAPSVDLPIASVMRSKHGTYPEYHTPQDDLSVISPKGLGDSFRCYQRIIETIEANRTYRVTTIGEPMLSEHGLYPTGTIGGPTDGAKIARDLCAYSDETMDLLAIAEATNRPTWELAPIATALTNAGLLREVA